MASPPKKCHRPKRLRKAMAADPNLSLETKDKEIRANITVIGGAVDADRKAHLRVTSQQSKVHVDVKEKTQISALHHDPEDEWREVGGDGVE